MKAKPLVADRPDSPPKDRHRDSCRCAAHGCPLPGTIVRDGTRTCALHAVADRAGWPRATAVAVDTQGLWTLSREAECAAFLPDDEIRARALFQAAGRHGLTFTDPQREVYKRAGIKLRAAGLIVQTAIAQAAADAALGAPAPQVAPDAPDAIEELAGRLAMKVAA